MSKKHFLLLLDCGKVTKQIPLDKEYFVIGRAEDADLALTGSDVSRRHAAIRFINGQHIIEDLKSTNGTLVNSQKVESQVLNHGDEIALGEHSLVFDDGSRTLRYVEETEITRRGQETAILSDKFSSLERKIGDGALKKEFRDIEKFVRRSRKRLATLAHADKLTGLFNRQYFDKFAKQEVEKAQSSGRKLSVLFIDLDHFKEVNDTHGHRTGDEVLRAVAWLVQESCRKTDLVARYGGEEIVVVLPNSLAADACKVAEEIREIVEKQIKEILDIPVTVSIGVATFPDDGKTLKAILHSADQALYEAKGSGRNRICKYHE
jgi:diguanylate cyclase (GGDEF)-like protein